MSDLEIVWTKVDEAPGLATFSLLPIVEAFVGDGRREDEAEGHFADRPHHRQLPRQADARAKDQRRARRTRQTCDAPRGQHHQAAQHLRLDPAAEGRDQGVAEQGLRRAELSGQRRDAGGQGNPRPLRQGARQRRQSGAARGQFRPPRRRRREAVRAQASAQDGRLDQGLENARGAHVGRRLLRFGGRDDHCGTDQCPYRAGRQRRRGHGAEGEDAAQGRRDHRLRR